MDREHRIECPVLSREYVKMQIKSKMDEITEYNICNYDGEKFVKECYRFFFGREVEAEGLQANYELMNQGMSKEGMLYYFYKSPEFNNRFQLQNAEFYKREYLKYEWDIGYVLSYDGWRFIEQCYKAIFDRIPDEAGGYLYTKMLYEGMPKEGILYILATSEEARLKKTIRNIDLYKRVYDEHNAYVSRGGIRNKLKNLIERITHNTQNNAELQAMLAINIMHQEQLEKRINSLEGQGNSSIGQTLDRLQIMEQQIQNCQTVINDMMVLQKQNNIRNQEMLSNNKSEVEALRFESRDYQEKISGLLNNAKTVVQSYPNGVTCVQVGNYLMGVPSEEWRLAMYLSKYGYFEYGTEKCFREKLKPGMTVVDIGANLGIFTLHALSGGCDVISFEPTPHTFRILKDNMILNGYEESNRVQLRQCAVGKEKGTCNFTTYTNICGHNSMFGEVDDTAEVIEVPVVVLDEEVPSGKKIDIIKIDVEGAEPLVFAGMQRIIRENENINIFMEFAPGFLRRAGFDPDGFLNEIETAGLRIRVINDETGEIEEIRREELLEAFSRNVFLAK